LSIEVTIGRSSVSRQISIGEEAMSRTARLLRICQTGLTPFRLKHSDTLPRESREVIIRERLVTCGNYSPLPVVLSAARGVHVFDVENRKYFDFTSAGSCVNQGHCHPAIVEAMVRQVSALHHVSRAFYCDALVELAETMTAMFGYVSFICFFNAFISSERPVVVGIFSASDAADEHWSGGC
jgi:hypothetical protein